MSNMTNTPSRLALKGQNGKVLKFKKKEPKVLTVKEKRTSNDNSEGRKVITVRKKKPKSITIRKKA